MDGIQDLHDEHGRLAYAVLGSGPPLVYVPDLFIPIDAIDEDPPYAQFLAGLASFATVVTFDRRNVGFSDPIEDWTESVDSVWATDIRRIVDGVVGGPATLVGVGTQSALAAITAAAVAPDRIARLVLVNPVAAVHAALAGDEVLRNVDGESELDFGSLMSPSRAGDAAFVRWTQRAGRRGASPADARRLWGSVIGVDHRFALAKVRVPTTVVLRAANPWRAVATTAREIVATVPDAHLVELSGADVFPNGDDVEELVHALADVMGATATAPGGTTIVSLLFSDIVGSTRRTGELGNARWRGMLDIHDEVVAKVVARHGGTVVKQTGDGVLATFPLPSRALRAAVALRAELARSDLEVRIAVHTAEVERRGEDVNGVGVNLAARILSCAGGGEILVSAAIPLVVAGSGFGFSSRGRHELRGVTGDLELFALDEAGPGS